MAYHVNVEYCVGNIQVKTIKFLNYSIINEKKYQFT